MSYERADAFYSMNLAFDANLNQLENYANENKKIEKIINATE
jgi:hypothetical protein